MVKFWLEGCRARLWNWVMLKPLVFLLIQLAAESMDFQAPPSLPVYRVMGGLVAVVVVVAVRVAVDVLVGVMVSVLVGVLVGVLVAGTQGASTLTLPVMVVWMLQWYV